jgi:hypothetical protein
MTKAASSTSQSTQDLMTLSQALFRDLPVVAARWGFGLGDEKTATAAAWKIYDAGIRVATTAIDTLYRTPLFSDAVSNSANQLLRWQQMGNAVNRVLLAGFWQMLGVPTAAEIQALAEQVRMLETHMNESMQNTPHRTSPIRFRSQSPFADGSSHRERKNERPQETRPAA